VRGGLARGLAAVPADDLAMAYRRLNASYQQTLRYAEDVRRLYRQVQGAIYQSLLGLANALEAKDAYTRGHSERVGRWSRQAARALGLAPEEAEMIGQAGLLHDIGKIGVPEAVLRKRAGLEADEWAQMRRHPVVGAQIVAPFEFFAAGAITIRHHHERLDGSGYPDGLAGAAIPLGARVVAVADVYDALTSDRPYRAALTPAGKAHPITRLLSDPGANEEAWKKLPPLTTLNRVGRAKGETLVLASDGARGTAPLLAVGRFEKGRSLAFMSDDLWRWNFIALGEKESPQNHLKLVRQAVRWLAQEPSFEQVQIGAIGGTRNPGEKMDLKVRVFKDDFTPAPNATVRLRAVGPEGEEIPLDAMPEPAAR